MSTGNDSLARFECTPAKMDVPLEQRPLISSGIDPSPSYSTLHRQEDTSSSLLASTLASDDEMDQDHFSVAPTPDLGHASSHTLPEKSSLPPPADNTVPSPAAASNGGGSGTGTGTGSVRPWILFLIFAAIQLLLSSPMPSNGVNASSDQSSDSSSNANGQGAHGGGPNTRQYFRLQHPILDSSKAPGKIVSERMTEGRRLELRQEAKDMFMHGYRGYITHAFPMDELNPVLCAGRGPDKHNTNNINVNDVLGDFSLTLIDSLDTLAAMREPDMFHEAIKLVQQHVAHFDIDSRVQVFEVNIRVLGALLSGHLYASDPAFQSIVKGYRGELLTMAIDLGKRLLRAFDNTPTGIPWPRVNLRRGVIPEESPETCVAGAGSLLLEFGVLSRLSGDRSFEDAAKKALFELWNRRSSLGIVGNTINITSGEWMSVMTGIGAGTDSFYEYLLKSYVLFGDEEYLEMYEQATEAIRRNLLHDSKYFYKHVHLQDGSLLASWVDSLSAFMPGVQVLGGDLESAIKNHLYYYNIWRKYQAIPERFNFVTQDVDIANYPLRPEFIESNYFLYRATKDPFYLEVGEMILKDLQRYTRTKCGWASLQSVVDKKFEDRMESFALSETFKYLYLLFDEENLLHQELKDSNFVFTTEGHVLALNSKQLGLDRDTQVSEWSMRYPEEHPQFAMGKEDQVSQPAKKMTATKKGAAKWPMCKPYLGPATFLKSIPYRPDADFARQMVGTQTDARDVLELDPKGYCETPVLEIERVVVEFTGPPAKTFFDDGYLDQQGHKDGTSDSTKEDAKTERALSTSKQLTVIPVKQGVFVNKIVGVRMQLQYEGAQNGYRAIRVGDYSLSLNSNIYIDRGSMQPLWDSYQRQQDAYLRIFLPAQNRETVEIKDLLIMPADFGQWSPRVLDSAPPPPPASPSTSSDDRQASFAEHSENDTKASANADASSPPPPSQPQQPNNRHHRQQRPIVTKELVRIPKNTKGCRPFTSSQMAIVHNKILVLDRGECLFILKAYYAQAAGAHGVVIINTDDTAFAMSGSGTSTDTSSTSSSVTSAAQAQAGTEGTTKTQLGEGLAEDSIDIHSVMMGQYAGRQLLKWIQENESSSSSSRSSPLQAGFIQSKVTKEQLANARLSYNSLPIFNVMTLAG